MIENGYAYTGIHDNLEKRKKHPFIVIHSFFILKILLWIPALIH